MRLKHLLVVLAGILLFVAVYVGMLRDSKPSIGIPSSLPHSLSRIEIADDPEERALGLGGRAEILDDYGMLFVFEVPDTYGFWMADMQVPIDIIWLSDEGVIVGIESSVPPESFPETFQPSVPVRFVLETRAGLAAERGWMPGTLISLPQ